ncbi:hypothetical protein EBN88_01525 [Streptomyces triticirhizae]|uniref:Uncharacterized protein n=1 Tax=Streptomyces triticirhizae TaxID=2483353 RepID=A0A3M2M9X5_9ACTN|nr:hypothetical protein EBN88_01525 [Streptomyces triticirhizae]
MRFERFAESTPMSVVARSGRLSPTTRGRFFQSGQRPPRGHPARRRLRPLVSLVAVGAVGLGSVLVIDADTATARAADGPAVTVDPGAYPFRMFLNYDGAGGRFGETGGSATSEDSDQVSVFAAERAEDGALTVPLINKSTSPLSVPLTVTGLGDASAEAYQYGEADPSATAQLPDVEFTDGGAGPELPGYSITRVVIPGGAAGGGPASSPEPTADAPPPAEAVRPEPDGSGPGR